MVEVSSQVWILLLAGGLFGLALILAWAARLRRRSAGLPGGRIIYSDTGAWMPVSEPLYDPELSLTGKPDYLVARGGQMIPVEVKSSRIPDAPYDAHIFQLSAYCLLVQQAYRTRPAYGLLHYTGSTGQTRTFQIMFTAELEGETRSLITDMHAQNRRKIVARSHSEPARCQGCGYREHCEESLV